MFNPGIFDETSQESYKAHWTEHGWISLDKILNDDYFNAIRGTLPTLNYDYRGGAKEWYETVPSSKPADGKLLQQKITYSAEPGDYSYFHRIHGINKDCNIDNPYTHKFAVDMANSEQQGATFRDWVQDITGFTGLKTIYPTFSFYKHDNWITSHYDPKRKVAYLFYFTEDWKKEYGGELCLQDEMGRVTTTIMPLPNRLVLLDVSRDHFNKHFVSPISYIAPTARYSFVGWFS